MRRSTYALIGTVVFLAFIGIYYMHGKLFWTGGQMLGCPDCVVIRKLSFSGIRTFVCPSSLAGVDHFAGCIVYTYDEFPLKPGESITFKDWSGGTVEYYGYCDARWLNEYKCEGNYVYRLYKSHDCTTSWHVYKNCDSLDVCKGTTYYDYYCSGGSCVYTTHPNDARCGTVKGKINVQFAGAVVALSIIGLIIYLAVLR